MDQPNDVKNFSPFGWDQQAKSVHTEKKRLKINTVAKF